jgi:hypothetical protein
VDIYDPLAARTRPTTATAETQVQQPRTTASSTYRAASSAYQTPQANTNTNTDTQTQDQQQPSQEPPMPNEQNMPTPFVAPPCPTCAPAPHWPWILALIVGGGLGWYIGSRKKSKKSKKA